MTTVIIVGLDLEVNLNYEQREEVAAGIDLPIQWSWTPKENVRQANIDEEREEDMVKAVDGPS